MSVSWQRKQIMADPFVSSEPPGPGSPWIMTGRVKGARSAPGPTLDTAGQAGLEPGPGGGGGGQESG